MEKIFENFLKVAVYQSPAIEANPNLAIEKVHILTKTAEKQDVDILLFPESFLHGYFESKTEARQFSIDLNSSEFFNLCHSLKNYKPTILLGLNEKQGKAIYNTIVVIENGQLIGKYSKATTYPPYDYYTVGREFPVFNKRGITYGIMICYDTIFFEPARLLALNGAQIIFCPCFNRTPRNEKMAFHLHNKSYFATRAVENYTWLVVSDVIVNTADYVSPGASCIIDPNGYVVSQGQILTEGLISYNIPLSSFKPEKQEKLLYGQKELMKMIIKKYED